MTEHEWHEVSVDPPEIGEVTAAATFYMAEVYFDFSQALLESERPADLAAADRTDYEMALEEEAFPFEEKAIEVHEKNLELMASGIYNAWIERSLGRLANLVPGRYAKFEASSGLIASIDTYEGPLEEAAAGLSVTIRLEDELDISRGDMIGRPHNQPQLRDKNPKQCKYSKSW